MMEFNDPPHFRRERMKFHSSIESFGILPENDEIDSFTVVQRVSGKGLAGSEIDVEVK
jgi:hypothetical protein